MPLAKTWEKRYLYPGMDWESFEEKLDTLSFQQSRWDNFKNGIRKCLQFLGIAFLLLLGILLGYGYENQEYLWKKYTNPQEQPLVKPVDTSTAPVSQEIGQILYEYQQQMLKHINQKYQEMQLQFIKLQSAMKENHQEKGKSKEILKEIINLKEEINQNIQKYSTMPSPKNSEESKEQKAWRDEIKKSTEQIVALQAQLKEWQFVTKNNGAKIEENQKEALPEKTSTENIQMHHYRALFPPSILIYLPQNYHKFFIGFQLTNRQYTVKEKYSLYQNFIAKGWYQIRLENWYKKDYLIKILYCHPFDLLPLDHKILELTSDYSMPQNIKTLRSFPIEEILNTDPGYGFVELLKREF